MTTADWARGFAGGLMIGSAAAVFLLVNGRIMGASGILGSLLDGSDRPGRAESMAFLIGLIGCPGLLSLLGNPAQTHLTGNLAVVALAGLLVGLGTRLAGGCTSGHGVCGISRLAPRSLAATAVYLLSGAATLLIARHLLGVI
ncbi:MAG: YeeE/YedE family protein [Rhodobacter sp.]|nr:YeeE/YedE family protein [Rhodobacter sp.]MCA3455647.1 YeeE/YedE family protein [Rhodobacter sp.]MCA3461637.1 YeeE/YedE family protein [Rhodobacter sp.]MCA3464042.1 YeeE/YedE family protein [Rhodobacter sp.]MCA3466211.1 YeeE/YedE family protein [Rhodobacter sp.]